MQRATLQALIDAARQRHLAALRTSDHQAAAATRDLLNRLYARLEETR